MAGKKKKPGPKPMPASRLREHIVGVKVNQAEYRKLVEAAGRFPLATWARDVLLREAERGGRS